MSDEDMSVRGHFHHFDGDGRVLLLPGQMGSSSCYYVDCRVMVFVCFSGNSWDDLSQAAIQRRYSHSLD